MLNKDQQQVAEGGSTAIQAQGNVTLVKNGLSYSEVRDVALDVFAANFYKLAGPAMEIAQRRAQEITEHFLKKLQKDFPKGMEKANDPDFQHALFTVQKEYARSGEKDLGDLLVDLLVDRSKQDKRNIVQIVLNESIDVAPKITDEQLAVLTIVFLMRYVIFHGIGNHDLLSSHFKTFIDPFSSKLIKNAACFQHLQFAGCGSTQEIGEIKLEEVMRKSYPGLFSKGFEATEVENTGIPPAIRSRYFTPCLNNPEKIQIFALNKDQLSEKFKVFNISPEAQKMILDLLENNIMQDDEIRNKCIELHPSINTVFETWNDSNMNSFTLTSVGIAIAHANVKRLVGEFANLSIWIN